MKQPSIAKTGRGFIYVVLWGLLKGKSSRIQQTGQKDINARKYSLAHFIDAIDEGEMDSANTLHCQSPVNSVTMYLVDVESLRLPTVGISDVRHAKNNSKVQQAASSLFLFRRNATWSQAWDSMINSFDDADSIACLGNRVQECRHHGLWYKILTFNNKTAKEVDTKAAAVLLATTETTCGAGTRSKKREK